MKENSYFQLLKNAMENAYSPYSRYRVGAVVLSQSGQMYAGANVENAAYPQGWCAEASALAAMIMGGETKLTEIAVMAEGDQICTPCGGCRQKLKEFALPGTHVLCYSPDELRMTILLDELLPHSFGASYLP
ncbi:MAG: cytidine deaminase [Acidiferrobacteraceae bacterium]|nr:cytidine deaminase [Acidiferrobacteraceae bacterium]|tara:strand:- start:1005 stop:1400 length:396 start_codon:yes stop_codon:yes gene_type:complete